MIKQIAQNDPDVLKRRYMMNRTILHEAVNHGCSIEVLETLFSLNLKLDETDDYSYTAINIAAFHRNIELVKKLAVLGADPYIADHTGKTALSTAIENDDLQLVEVLLRYGKIDARFPITVDVSSVTHELLGVLLEFPVAQLIFSRQKKSLLHFAIISKNTYLVESAIDQGLDPYYMDEGGENAIMLSLQLGLKDLANLMLRYASIECPIKYWSSLAGADSKYVYCIKLLIDHYGVTHADHPKWEPILKSCIDSNQERVLKALLKLSYPYPIDVLDRMLQEYIVNGNSKQVSWVVKFGADIEKK